MVLYVAQNHKDDLSLKCIARKIELIHSFHIHQRYNYNYINYYINYNYINYISDLLT